MSSSTITSYNYTMFELKHLDEFRQSLADYQMSDEAKRLVESVPYVGLTAITSSGRNTIIRELQKTGKFYFIVSDTTRPPRANNGVMEQNGVEYWFRTEEEVLADIQDGRYIEAAIIHNQQVSGQSIRELEIARDKKLIAINEFEVQGVDNILAVSQNLIPIFVLPPSYEEWIRRWTKRGEISDQERQRRIASARMELTMALKKGYYHFLVNDDLDKAVSGIQKIIAGQIDPKHEETGKQVAREILQKIS